jgi:hypothetical protein
MHFFFIAIRIRVKHDSKDRTVGTNKLGTRMLGQEQMGKTAGKGQLGKDSWDRATDTGKPGQESQYRTAGEDSR